MHRLTSAPPPQDPTPHDRRDDAGGPDPGEGRNRSNGLVRRGAAAVGFAAIGAALAVGALSSAGLLEGESTTTIIREPVDLTLAADESPPPPAPPPSSGDDGAPQPPLALPELVSRAAPSVVKVTPGDDERRVGSGFVVDDDGRILTNAHVIDDESSATVTFADGSEVNATLLGADQSTDLAVLDVETLPAGANPAQLGRSDGLEVGSGVVAIGNPFGLERTATSGIVSAIERVITAPNSFRIQNVIQTDAAINRGNSGGPLLDLRGRVVGINSQIATSGGGNVGIGFAVPIDTVVPVAESLIETGEAEHAWIGITGRALTEEDAVRLGRPGVRGVAIVGLDDRGSAEGAGLTAADGGSSEEIGSDADIIVAANGARVEDMADVTRAIAARRVGEQVELAVLRDGKRVQVTVPLLDRPDDVGLGRP